MSKYIIRLDDACPQMDIKKWEMLEKLFDEYGIKPIVGVIPDCKDPNINYGFIDDFWPIVRRWQNKGWTIAQHGFNHLFFKYDKSIHTFQKNTEEISEFVGLSFETQNNMINKGCSIMIENGVTPLCFFAPAHTFDSNTVKAVIENNCFRFISDGYGIYPFQKNNMIFFPSNFDTPHKMFGLQTFVIHPNNLKEKDIFMWKTFVSKNYKDIISADDYLLSHSSFGKQSIIGLFMENAIHIARLLRKKIYKG